MEIRALREAETEAEEEEIRVTKIMSRIWKWMDSTCKTDQGAMDLGSRSRRRRIRLNQSCAENPLKSYMPCGARGEGIRV
jgi:hypothetical protein